MQEIKNAVILDTFLGVEDHGIFTFVISLDYGGSSQGFGTYGLDRWSEENKKRIGRRSAIELIRKILETLEVPQWESLKGKHCRVVASHDKVLRIGHIIKNKWVDASEILGQSED